MTRTEKIRILFTIDQLGLGGKERRLGNLIKHLNKEQYQITLVTMHSAGEFQNMLESECDEIIVLKRKFRWDPFLFRDVVALVKRIEPDIIQSCDWMSAFYFRRVAGWSRIRFVNASIADTRKCISWRQRLKRQELIKSEYVVANSEAGLRAYWFKPTKRALFIHNGIPKPAPPVFDKTSDTIRIGIVANMTKTKDYPTVFRAIALLHAQCPHIILTVVGDGALKDNYLQIAHKLNLDNMISYLGKRTDVKTILQDIDIGILASYESMGEGFSNSVMEYMAAGKPVVVTNVGGTRELVRHGYSGFLVPSGTPKAMAERLEVLVKDAELRRRMGQYNYQYIVNHLSIERMAAKYDSLFQSIAFDKNHIGIKKINKEK